jgi:hypothetical protein
MKNKPIKKKPKRPKAPKKPKLVWHVRVVGKNDKHSGALLQTFRADGPYICNLLDVAFRHITVATLLLPEDYKDPEPDLDDDSDDE